MDKKSIWGKNLRGKKDEKEREFQTLNIRTSNEEGVHRLHRLMEEKREGEWEKGRWGERNPNAEQ